MDWVVTPVIGLLISSLAAYKIYTYRSLVIYEFISIFRHIEISGNDFVVQNTWTGRGLGLSLVKIRNHGFKNVKDFVFSVEESINLLGSKVVNTPSISSESITVKYENGHFLISCPYLPKNEKIDIEIVTDQKPMFWKIRGQGDQYRLESHAYLEGYRGALNVVFSILVIGFVLSIIGALTGLRIAG